MRPPKTLFCTLLLTAVACSPPTVTAPVASDGSSRAGAVEAAAYLGG